MLIGNLGKDPDLQFLTVAQLDAVIRALPDEVVVRQPAPTRRGLGARMFNNFEFLVSRARLWQARHEVGVFPAGTPHVQPQDLWPEDKAWLSEMSSNAPPDSLQA